jgi:hypothetical protein
MSPIILQEGPFTFYFHSFDVLHENRASVHVRKKVQNDENKRSSGMVTGTQAMVEHPTVKHYEIQYPASAYTFPSEARIHQAFFDDDYVHIELTDGRDLAIPLWWIPTLHNAAREELEKFEINRSRTMLIWDPDKCAINDELRIADYLGPCSNDKIDWDSLEVLKVYVKFDLILVDGQIAREELESIPGHIDKARIPYETKVALMKWLDNPRWIPVDYTALFNLPEAEAKELLADLAQLANRDGIFHPNEEKYLDFIGTLIGMKSQDIQDVKDKSHA